MSAEEAEQRQRRAEFFLNELDTNHNGVIEAEEVAGQKKFYADRLLQRAGIEPNYPIALSKAREAMQRFYQAATQGGLATPGMYGPMPGYYGGPGSPPMSGAGQNAEAQRQFEQIFTDFKHLDANNNGVIEADEATGGSSHSHKEIFEKTMAKAGLPATTPARVDLVRERLSAAYLGGSSGTAGYAGTSLVPGFGAAANQAAIPLGFGPIAGPLPAAMRTSAGSTPSASPSLPPPRNDEEARVREYAKSLLAQYDKNKDGVLQKEEWHDMRGDVKAADTNGDKLITLEELTIWLLKFSRNPGQSPSGGLAAATAGASAVTKGRPYRFSTAKDLLPSGLPDWYIQKDLDGDGQVSMAEYCGDWSDAKSAEAKMADFARYDCDGDGFITPAEYLRLEKLAKDKKGDPRLAKAEGAPAKAEGPPPKTEGPPPRGEGPPPRAEGPPPRAEGPPSKGGWPPPRAEGPPSKGGWPPPKDEGRWGRGKRG
jgi:Ca2+-binding EF-hand superfamily protein